MGTSFASPLIAALAALILGENSEFSPSDVKELILNCFVEDVEGPGFDEKTGWGRIKIPSREDAKPECLKL